ncbi:MAG TPA: DinB family protein [Candidatus Sulfotelmatobacter sp.]|jgi:uncharacterized damage-inducible protein DinB|nr:DinB family protein [Candidatus Sulfotelmatobacter sp.]
MISHFQLMARYNDWANRRLLDAAATVPEDMLWADRGVFFRSFLGTMNHLLVGDTMWLARFKGEPPPEGLKLDSVLHRGLEPFRTARQVLDESILAFTRSLDESRLASSLAYRTSAGQQTETPFSGTLFHVFNHQTHHRGQAHGVLTGLGAKGPELDLVYFIRLGG